VKPASWKKPHKLSENTKIKKKIDRNKSIKNALRLERGCRLISFGTQIFMLKNGKNIKLRMNEPRFFVKIYEK